MEPTKPGLTTTEHWLTVLTGFVSHTSIQEAPDWQTRVAAILVLGGVVTAYIWSRGKAKEGASK